jgi:hypothetical protein
MACGDFVARIGWLVPAAGRDILGILPGAGGIQRDGTSDTVLRQHDRTRPRLGCRGKTGQQHHAFGRSRGGFSTKIHLKTVLHGHPLDFRLTGGEVSDSTEFETSLDIGPDIRPHIAVTDKVYDSHSNRSAAQAGDSLSRKLQAEGTILSEAPLQTQGTHRTDHWQAQAVQRVAMRREKTDTSYSAIVSFACGLLLVKSVHTA